MTVKNGFAMGSTNPEIQQALEKCIEFLNGIGINTIYRQLEPESFPPGLSIENGCIIIDREALKYPGDILHEAGHIAVVPAADRATLDAASIKERPDREAEEMMAIAWSYAACIHLGLDVYFVFHDDGYKGGGRSIAENFLARHFFGTPMLQWCGMIDEKIFPTMIKWMRE